MGTFRQTWYKGRNGMVVHTTSLDGTVQKVLQYDYKKCVQYDYKKCVQYDYKKTVSP